jgi:hypothetical protein
MSKPFVSPSDKNIPLNPSDKSVVLIRASHPREGRVAIVTRVRVAKKREVLDAWAIELRRIIGEPAAAERRLAA